MKCGVVMFSELGNRWDAGFHLTRQQHAARTAELEATISREDAIQRLRDLPLKHLKPIEPLRRDNGRHPMDMAQARKVIAEYPHLCLAIIEATRDQIHDDLEAQIKAIDDKRLRLHLLTSPSQMRATAEVDRRPEAESPESKPETTDHSSCGPQAGYAYPLTNAQRYDDELGEGYDHAAAPVGEEGGRYSVRDMWPVKADGSIHPGYDQCPVPMTNGDYDLSRGVRVSKKIADRAKFMGWR